MVSKSKITHTVVFAKRDEAMAAIVEKMVQEKVSSVLVVDDDDNICGIITERDIVHKFTLLSKKDKLQAKAITLMSRPVNFVDADSIDRDIGLLHENLQVRHFPVLMGTEPKLENLVGMLTATDMLRIWIENSKKEKAEKVEVQHHLTLIMSHKITRAKYKKLLEKLSCEVYAEGLYIDLVAHAQKRKMVLVFDLDGDYGPEAPQLITKVLSTGSHVLFLTNRHELAAEFKKNLKNDLHHIMIKPLEISYLNYLLEQSREESQK